MGDEEFFSDFDRRGLLRRYIEPIQRGMGSKTGPTNSCTAATGRWPPCTVYRDFVRRIVPEEHHETVFHNNARALFKLPAGS